MTKPTFINIISMGWDASSPFAYTLQRTLKYAHFGYSKNFTLFVGKYNEKTKTFQGSRPELSEKVINNTWENWNYNKGHYMNHTEDLEPLKDFSLTHFGTLIKDTLGDAYIQFYLQLYNHVSTKGYKAVACFNERKSKSDNEYIKKYFNVKPICLCRDPVRRAISNCIKYHGKPIDNMDIYFKDYVPKIKYFKTFLPNLLIIPMEELWEDDGTTKQKLSKFLGTPVHSLWPNLYSPDIGHHLQWNLDKHYCPVPCQVIGQSSFEITPEVYNFYRKKYSYIYDTWKKHFGSLPLHWGEHIDYDKNLQIYPHYNLKKPLRDFL